MGKKVTIQLASRDRDRLEALIANGNTPQKHVRRAERTGQVMQSAAAACPTCARAVPLGPATAARIRSGDSDRLV